VSVGACALTDLNGDGVVNTNDLVILLSKFGQNCQSWTGRRANNSWVGPGIPGTVVVCATVKDAPAFCPKKTRQFRANLTNCNPESAAREVAFAS